MTVGVLVMAYGGPDSMDDVEPFLLDVRGGRATPAELIAELRDRYRAIGGRSPIHERTAAQAAALEQALRAYGPYSAQVGMRHWVPRIADSLALMAGSGIQRAVGVVMAPHYSRMSIGAYFDAVAKSGSAIEVVPVEDWHLLPEFLDALASRIEQALEQFPADSRSRVLVLFTAHSLPERIRASGDPYPTVLAETVDAVAARIGPQPYRFAYQSAGRSAEPWLGPGAEQVLREVAGDGARGVIVVPIGFTSDHIEILFDVDIELAAQAQRAGIGFARIPMINDDPNVMAGLARLVHERAARAGWV